VITRSLKPALRSALFQTHWLFGITAGLVLALVGVTGALMSFEEGLLLAFNRGVMTVAPRPQPPLSPPEVLARIHAQHPERRVMSFTVWSDPARAMKIVFSQARRPGEAPAAQRGETRYADPYCGELLAAPRGVEFFRKAREIHRWLAAGEIGKQIVGASTIALVLLCLSGLYLRWPRNTASWRAWLTVDFSRRGRSFLIELHKAAGTWVLVPYLMMGLTGLYWSYGWYRDALFAITGTQRPLRQAPESRLDKPEGARDSAKERRSDVDVAAVWSALQREAGAFRTATVRLPARPRQPVQITYLDRHAAHDRAYSRLTLDASSAAVTRHERYVEKTAGGKLMTSMLALHSGSFFGVAGSGALMLASLLMPLFAITGWMLYVTKRGRRKALPAARAAEAAVAFGSLKSKQQDSS